MAKLNFSIALGLAANNFKQGLSNVQNQLNGFAKSVKSMFGMVAGAFAAGQIKAFSKECLDAYSAQMQAEQKLGVIMKERMGATDKEVKSVMNLASAQQKLGVIGDEVQLAGAQQVATFLNEKKSLDTLIPAMNNLLAQQKGLSATQGDAVNIGNLMGKVLQGQTSALKRVGISFSEAEEKVLKYGSEQERAAMLAEVIKNNVGDMNAALAQTDMGKIQQMNNILGDTKEKIGAAIAPIVSKLAPSIAKFAEGASDNISNFVTFVGDHFQTLAKHIVAVFAAIKLTKFFAAIQASAQANSVKVIAAAKVAAVKRENIEKKVSATITKIREQETLAAKLQGDKQIVAEQKVVRMRQQLKEQLKERNKLAEAQIAADAQVAALKTQSAWSRGMAACKAAVSGFVTGAKAMLKSFAVTAVITVAIEAIMKLYDTLQNTNESFQRMAEVVNESLGKAFDWLVEKLSLAFKWLDDLDTETGAVSGTFQVLGAVIMACFNNAAFIIRTFITLVSTLIKLAGDLGDAFKAIGSANWDGAKQAVVNMGQHIKDAWKAIKNDGSNTYKQIGKDFMNAFSAFDSSADAALKRAQKKETARVEAKKKKQNDGGSGSGSKTKTTKKESEYEKFLQNYTDDIAKADAELKLGNITEKEYNQKRLDITKSAQVQLETMKPANDVEKQLIEAKKLSLAAERKRYEQLTTETVSLDTEALSKVGTAKYDTTFDYKKTNSEIVQAKLEIDIENAKERLEELKRQADAGCEEAKQKLNDAIANVDSLEDQLKLAKVKEDIQNLQQEMNNLTMEGIQQGWQAVEGTVSSISSLVDTLSDPDASGWEKFAAVINTVMSLMQTFTGIMETVNAITEISNALAGAKAASTQLEAKGTTELAAAETTLAAATPVATAALSAQAGVAAGGGATSATAAAGYSALASALEIEAAAAIFAAHASMPFVGVPMASGFVATMEGVLDGVKTAAVALKLSTGGKVKGNSPVGDFVPALLNSGETVINTTQESRLLQLANGGGVAKAQGGKVEFEIHRNTLRGILNNGNMRDSHIN